LAAWCRSSTAKTKGRHDSTYGAVPLLDAPLFLLLPLATIEVALKKAGKC
jgi:hypothetical protein